MARGLHEITIANANRALVRRKLSSRRKAHLARLAALDEALNSYLLVGGNRGVPEAVEPEAGIMRGGLRGRRPQLQALMAAE